MGRGDGWRIASIFMTVVNYLLIAFIFLKTCESMVAGDLLHAVFGMVVGFLGVIGLSWLDYALLGEDYLYRSITWAFDFIMRIARKGGSK